MATLKPTPGNPGEFYVWNERNGDWVTMFPMLTNDAKQHSLVDNPDLAHTRRWLHRQWQTTLISDTSHHGSAASYRRYWRRNGARLLVKPLGYALLIAAGALGMAVIAALVRP